MCETYEEALSCVNLYLDDIKENENIEYKLVRCRMVREPNLQKIGASFTAPDSILWERHWGLHGPNGEYEFIKVTEGWV